MDHLLIKSIDRKNTSASSSNFIIELPSVIEGKYLVNLVLFPNSLNNVITGYNDKVYAGSGSATLTAGLYTATNLATEVQTQLQTIDANFSCTYSSATGKFTIAHTTGSTIDFGSNTSASCRRLIGFSATDLTSATSHSSDLRIDLAPQKSITIQINEASHTIKTTSPGYVPASIYVAVAEAFGDTINQTWSEVKQYITFDRTRALTIKCYDTSGNLLNMNGLDWEMLLSKE